MHVELTAQAAADLVGGRLLGDGAVALRRVAPLDVAGPDAVTFAVGSRYREALGASTAGAVLVPPALAEAPSGASARIVVAEPQRALVTLLRVLYPAPLRRPGIDPTARLGAGVELGAEVEIGAYVVLGRDVRLGARCRIAPGVVIGDGVELGEDCELAANVVCYAGTRLGRRVRVKAGAVIGSEGFGFISGPDGHLRIPHIGGCRLEDDVEIGAGCTIDRGSVDDTVIGRGTKLDNQVHVGHNVRIGADCLLMGDVGIGGSTRVGDRVVLAGQCTIIDHVAIGDGARVAARSFVIGDVPAGATVSGDPARPHRETLRAQAALRRLAPHAAALEDVAAERKGRE